MHDQPRIGDRFHWRTKGWRIDRLRLEHEKLEISADDGDANVISISAFREELASGEVRRIARDRSGREHVVDPAWASDERETARTERQMREAILAKEAHEVRLGKSLTEARLGVEALCREKEWEPPCERTLRNWRRDARGHASMLSPRWFRCGNRRQGPDARLLEAMEEVAQHALLVNDRFTLTAAWGLVEALYAKKCEGDANRGPQQRRRYSIKQFQAFLRKIDWIEQMGSRLDSRTRRALTRVAVNHHTADFLWELVEMDASWLDIQIRNAEGARIGRPILYAAIDVASGYPVGLALTIQKPSAPPFVDCLRFMYFPKPGLDEKHGIQNRIEVFAKPVKMSLDNGSEFVGEVATAVVRVLLGDSARCKPYTPQEKPHVERFFGIVRNYIRTQPGSTISAITEEPRKVPESERLLTFEDLEGRLFRFIFDEYALMPNDLRSWKWAKALSPLDLVREMKKSQMETYPVSRDEFERTIHYKRDSRVLNLDGMSFDGWIYHSDELADLYRRHSHGKYEFSYSDIDAVTIYVHSKDGSETVPATAKHLRGLTVDRQTARELRKEMARNSEILNERTFANRLARFEEAKADNKLVGKNNKTERTKERLAKAREATRATMPLSSQEGVPAPSPAAQPSADPVLAPVVSHDSTQPFGRKRGAR
jgi:hypothetical protein